MAGGNQEDTSPGEDEWLTPGQVAELFGVDPKTVTRWANAGKLPTRRTLGGHRRYRASTVYELLEQADPSRRPPNRENQNGAAG